MRKKKRSDEGRPGVRGHLVEDVEEEEWDSDLPRLRGRSFGDIQKEVDEDIRRAVGEGGEGKSGTSEEEEE